VALWRSSDKKQSTCWIYLSHSCLDPNLQQVGTLFSWFAENTNAFLFIFRLQRMVEINFLCVHKKLRSKRVAPVLIREITRRVNQQGIFQAVYTAGVVLPKPVGACRYYHRSLNPKKLIEVKFSHLARNMTLQRTLKLNKLPDMPKCDGFRKLTPADVDKTHTLLNKVDIFLMKKVGIRIIRRYLLNTSS